MSEEETIMEILSTQMKDLLNQYDEICGEDDAAEMDTNALLDLIDDIFGLHDKEIAILRVYEHRLQVIERLLATAGVMEDMREMAASVALPHETEDLNMMVI